MRDQEHQDAEQIYNQYQKLKKLYFQEKVIVNRGELELDQRIRGGHCRE